MKLKLFLTFDHELPLGKLKTSYQSALFEPSNRVLEMAGQLGVRVTLFSDILCAVRFREWDNENFYVPYKKQLQNALNQGHDVQLHIHPHWLTSGFENSCIVPSNDFALACFDQKPEFAGISGVLKLGINELTEICKAEKRDYKCLAYRAGGYNIAPATSLIFKSLYDLGIRFDSSIAPGYYFKSAISEVDFRKMPGLANWTVNPGNYHTPGKGTGLTEIPIATIPKTAFEIPTLFKMRKYAFRAPVSHGEMIHTTNPSGKTARLKMMFSSRMLSFDNYTFSPAYLMKILDYNIRKYKSADTLMLSVIAHPKSMGDYSFDLMKNFVRDVRNKYPDAEFLTFTDLLKN